VVEKIEQQVRAAAFESEVDIGNEDRAHLDGWGTITLDHVTSEVPATSGGQNRAFL
jgi:hypothetical protein